ncbi:GNAT family N-acetyltransferase [Roseobacter weihaiensis]|uniref:hypothetical protein n=1 Tax=Roseobacter weihaiensis TaxID=2763262 RepID=UPI001D0ADFDA|nr:hypothetical protein [Roseobacter sp. H9]
MDSFVADDRLQRAGLATARTVEAHRTQVCALTRSVHEKSLFGDIPFSDAKLNRAFDKTLKVPERHLGLVVSLDGRVLGCCYCALGDYFIGEGARIVTVNALCVEPEVSDGLLGGKVALRLAKGIEVWARSQQATHILYHVTAGIEIARADRFFRKIGMRQLGGNYAFEMPRINPCK